MELENHGNVGFNNAGCKQRESHWEARISNDALMVATSLSYSQRILPMTLAVFEDSGWYEVDYTMAGFAHEQSYLNLDTTQSGYKQFVKGIDTGYQKGCGFARDNKCITSSGAATDEIFCTDIAKEKDGTAFLNKQKHTDYNVELQQGPGFGCHANRMAYGTCSASEGSSFKGPSQYKYFSGFSVSYGPSVQNDFCPKMNNYAGISISCIDPLQFITDTETSVIPTKLNNFGGESFSSKSRCFASSLKQAGSSGDTATFDRTQGCYEIDCTSNEHLVIKLKLNTDDGTTRSIKCYEWDEGTSKSIEGFTGTIKCVSPTKLCRKSYPASVENCVNIDNSLAVTSTCKCGSDTCVENQYCYDNTCNSSPSSSTTTCSTGANGQSCGSNGTPTGSYTTDISSSCWCNCKNSYSGNNCDTAPTKTCADITGTTGGVFNCANHAKSINASPASVTCDAQDTGCTATECCTVTRQGNGGADKTCADITGTTGGAFNCANHAKSINASPASVKCASQSNGCTDTECCTVTAESSSSACTKGKNGAPCQNSGSATGTTGNCGCTCVNNFSGANCETAGSTDETTTDGTKTDGTTTDGTTADGTTADKIDGTTCSNYNSCVPDKNPLKKNPETITCAPCTVTDCCDLPKTEYKVQHIITLQGIAATIFNNNPSIITSFRQAVALTLDVPEIDITNILATEANRRQLLKHLPRRSLVKKSCR